YNIAKLAADKGNKTLAVLEYKESLKLNSKYYHAMNNLANILKDLNQTVDAEYLLMNAVKLKPDFAAAWMNLGIVRSSLKKFSEAETNYLMALKLRKKYADCMFNLGNLYLEQKRFNDAILMWRNATKLKPKLVAAWINLLLLIDSIGETNDAITIAEEALNFIKEDSLLHFNYANLLGKMRRFEDAENHYLKAIRLKEEAIYFANLGVLYHQWNKLEAAKSAYEHALHLDPSLKITKDNIRILMKNAKIKK
ncbi:Transmembrane and TPR repeat-containing protein 4-like protein, partial [Leptotrombidium deliense]